MNVRWIGHVIIALILIENYFHLPNNECVFVFRFLLSVNLNIETHLSTTRERKFHEFFQKKKAIKYTPKPIQYSLLFIISNLGPISYALSINKYTEKETKYANRKTE